MSTYILSQVARLSDQDLVAAVKLLAHKERTATAALIAHLAVLDERRLYLPEGCSSLFTYCTQVLHLSEHAAYNRIEAARAARKLPVILALLAEGTVNLTTVRLLAPHLTVENHFELLHQAGHKGKRQVEELVARLRPQVHVPSTIRQLPIPRSTSGTTPAVERDETMVLAASGTPAPSEPLALPRSRRAQVKPLAPRQYRVQFTAQAETYERLRLAQHLLRHQIPDGDLGKVIDQALVLLLKHLAKQKHAAVEQRPRIPSRVKRRPNGMEEIRNASARSRHTPAEVKRAVWARDGGVCAFVAATGRRCTEQAFLEFHHVVPYAVGGQATADNIQLRCRAHNGYEAEQVFGRRNAAGG